MFQDLQTTFYDIYFAKKDLDSNGSWYEGPVVQIGEMWIVEFYNKKIYPKKIKETKKNEGQHFCFGGGFEQSGFDFDLSSVAVFVRGDPPVRTGC